MKARARGGDGATPVTRTVIQRIERKRDGKKKKLPGCRLESENRFWYGTIKCRLRGLNAALAAGNKFLGTNYLELV